MDSEGLKCDAEPQNCTQYQLSMTDPAACNNVYGPDCEDVPRLDQLHHSQAVQKFLQAAELLSSCGLNVCVAVTAPEQIQFWTSGFWRSDLTIVMRQAANLQAGLSADNMDLEMFVDVKQDSQQTPKDAGSVDRPIPVQCEVDRETILCEAIEGESDMKAKSIQEEDIPGGLRVVTISSPPQHKKRMSREKSEIKKIKSETHKEKNYLCTECGFATAWYQCLVTHMRRHSGERPYQCLQCESKFSRTNQLKRHIRIHTGERPYKCKYCDYASAQSSQLRQHTKRHTGEKPLQCELCGYRTAHTKCLVAHMRNHTGEMFTCEHCNYKTNRNDNLLKHIRGCRLKPKKMDEEANLSIETIVNTQ